MKGLCVTALVVATLIMFPGCRTEEQMARELMQQGKYEELIARNPYYAIRFRAKDKLAEQKVLEGKYDEVLRNFADTPSASEAERQIANKLLQDEKYQEILDRFPATPAADSARKEISADSLFDNEDFYRILKMYPNTKAAKKVADEYPEVIVRLKDEERHRATEELLERRGRCLRYPITCFEIGMRAWEVRSLIGSSDHVNRSVSAYGVREQWVYGTGGYRSVYLYFEDGILTSWQE